MFRLAVVVQPDHHREMLHQRSPAPWWCGPLPECGWVEIVGQTSQGTRKESRPKSRTFRFVRLIVKSV